MPDTDDPPIPGHDLLPDGYFIPGAVDPVIAAAIGKVLKGEMPTPFTPDAVDGLVRLMSTPPPIVKG